MRSRVSEEAVAAQERRDGEVLALVKVDVKDARYQLPVVGQYSE